MGTPVEVTVGTTPTQLAQVSYGQEIYIENTGATAVSVSPSAAITASTGIELAGGTPGGSITVDRADAGGDTWYGVVASGTTTVIVMVS